MDWHSFEDLALAYKVMVVAVAGPDAGLVVAVQNVELVVVVQNEGLDSRVEHKIQFDEIAAVEIVVE